MTTKTDLEKSQLNASAKKSHSQLKFPKFLSEKTVPRFRCFIAVPQQVFLAIGLFFGILFLIVIPPGQVPDEYIHFYRAYQVSDGQPLVQLPVAPDIYVGGLIPRNVVAIESLTGRLPFHTERTMRVEQLTDLLRLPLNADDKIFRTFPNTALYPPLPYIPAAIGIDIGKPFNISPLLLWYLARLGNLLSYLALVFFAIKIIPIFKWAFLLMALTPMALSQAASVSEDCITNGLAFFFIALNFYYTFTFKERLGKKQLILLFAMGMLVSLTKPSFFPLLILFTILPIARFGSLKRYLIMVAAMIAAGAVALVAWNQVLTLVIGKITQLTPTADISPGDQLNYVLRMPVRATQALWTDFTQTMVGTLGEYIGKLGWVDTPLSPFLILAYGLFLTFVVLIDNNPVISLNYVAKLKIGVAMLGCLGATIFLLYLSWSPVGSYKYLGVQGRYLIPIVPLFAFLFYNRSITFHSTTVKNGLLVSIFSFVVLSLTLTTVSDRYYGDTLIPSSDSLGSDSAKAVGEILPGKPFQETFVCPVKKLEDLDVYIATYARTNTSQFELALLDSQNKQIESQTFNAKTVKDNSWVFLRLPHPVEPCYGNKFSLVISSINGTPGNAVTTVLFPHRNEGSYQPVFNTRPNDNKVLGLAFNGYNRRDLLTPQNFSPA